jgi:hypothetical protein
VIQVSYQGPPHPLLGLVSLLEDADFEVTYDPPDLSSREPVAVELSLTDIQLQGVDRVEAVVREFEDRHAGLPVTVRARHSD